MLVLLGVAANAGPLRAQISEESSHGDQEAPAAGSADEPVAAGDDGQRATGDPDERAAAEHAAAMGEDRASVATALPAELVAVAASPRAADAGRAADARLQLRQLDQRRRLGLGLLLWGAASVLGGGVALAASRGRTEWLAAGSTTAAFGAINAGLSLGLLDLGARRRATLVAGEGPSREEARVAQLRSGQVFALNLGLDVAYMAAGALMFALGRRGGDRGDLSLRGAGLAMVSQGLGLFVFDAIAWRATSRHGLALAPTAF
ncbi:MAG: hypothetical protein AAF645_19470 [Myxococcota bacterium]